MARSPVKKCPKCKRSLAIKNFVSGFDEDEKDFWCTDCRIKYCTTTQRLQEYCGENLREFNLNLWNKAITTNAGDEQKAISYYFSKMNMTQNKRKLKVKPEMIESEKVIPKKYIKFWGKLPDYIEEDYKELEEKYTEFITRYKSDTPGELLLYKQICLQEMRIQKCRELNKGDIVKEIDALNKLMDSASIKPKDVNAANDPSNFDVLGVIIKDIETTRPAEYFADKKMFADFDGIKEYCERFILRPLKNLLTGSRDFDKEFSIENIQDDVDNEEDDIE